MSYRIKNIKPPVKKRSMQSTSTLSEIFLANGATSHLAIPCFYKEITSPDPAVYHNRHLHDHLGWPSPNWPDHSCQSWDFAHACNKPTDKCSFVHEKGYCCKRLNMDELIPVHLIKDGYMGIEIAFSDKPNGLEATGYIDQNKDWIVRIDLSANCPDAIKNKVTTTYSVFANGMINDRDVSSIVATGVLSIIPGPFEV